MKKILVLTTGGTIVSRKKKQGLVPAIGGKELVASLRRGYPDYHFDFHDFLDLDSSNIQPEEWKAIAGEVYTSLTDYDGIIVTHGTDTMAYTAAALSFMLKNLAKSVVLTGSQLPIENPLTDGTVNLYTAVEAIVNGITGVSVAFDRKIICGTRAVKTSTMGFAAFESINAPYLGEIFADGTRIIAQKKPEVAEETSLEAGICNDVFILKLLPGTRPEIFTMLADMGYKGIVIEAFGAGGLHYLTRDLHRCLSMLAEKNIAVVVCSQCLYEHCDLSIYEVGQRMLETGVIPGRDMTTEAAAVKLMWALGQSEALDDVKAIFDVNFAGEVTV